MGTLLNQPFPASDYERKRKYKLVESIRESANTIHNFFDKLEEETDSTTTANLEVSEVTGE